MTLLMGQKVTPTRLSSSRLLKLRVRVVPVSAAPKGRFQANFQARARDGDFAEAGRRVLVRLVQQRPAVVRTLNSVGCMRRRSSCRWSRRRRSLALGARCRLHALNTGGGPSGLRTEREDSSGRRRRRRGEGEAGTCSETTTFIRSSHWTLGALARAHETYLRMMITRMVMIAPRKMKPPKMATAMIPSRLFLAFASELCELALTGA